MSRTCTLFFLAAINATFLGCSHKASVTAVPLSKWNQDEPEGIPYYLPKPLLVVAKNVRHIDEAKVGLTDPAPIPNGFDNQAAYADIKANVTVPGTGASLAASNAGAAGLTSAFDTGRSSVPEGALTERLTPSGRLEDGIAPDSFYTYQIVFVPDLSQKYGLRIEGGPGEIRAAMNLVNGWMYTGMGPYYIKDSSTAQNLMAAGVGSMFAGRGVANVLDEVNELARVPGSATPERAPVEASDLVEKYSRLARMLQSETLVPQTMVNYAEVHIYEPSLNADGTMCWNLIASHSFDRHYFQPALSQPAIDLFNKIIESQNVQNDGRLERARAERARAERAAAGAGQSIGSPERAPEETLPGSDPSTTTPPPSPGTSSEANILEIERRLLELPPTAQPATTHPTTDVNVNVDLSENESSSPLFHWPFHRKQETPKHERRSLNIQSVAGRSTVGATAGPGASVGR